LETSKRIKTKGEIMTVRELVGGEVVGIEPSATMRDATRLMSDRDVGALAVQLGGRLVGILSERDVMRSCADGADLDIVTVGDWMTRDPDALDPDMTVEDAAEWMLAAGYRHLPILDGVSVVGMVSIKDILWGLTEPSAV
jgi:CBS domain-containing protein